jgi:hypothetical protein
VNKKKQKNFVMLGYGLCQRQRPRPSIKKFLRRFFQKAALSSLYAPDWTTRKIGAMNKAK